MTRGICIVLALAVAPSWALAADQPKDGLTYDGKLAEGHASYLAGNFEGALASYSEARDTEPGKAQTYYFMGWAQARLDRTSEAVASLRTAASVAGEKDQSLHARVLFSVAVLLERSGDRDGAAEAWASYLEYARAHGDAKVFEDEAQARLDAIDRWRKLVEDYAPVKRRADKGSEE